MKIVDLFEGLSPILFHYTSLVKTNAILTGDEFLLVPAFGPAEKMTSGENKLFFLSTTRSRRGGYHSDVIGNYGVLLELDGRKLGQRYSGKAVDYWGEEFRKLGKNEMEDRIFHTDYRIPQATKYINSIHVLRKSGDVNSGNDLRLRKLAITAKRRAIPLYVYETDQDWLSMRPEKASQMDWSQTKQTEKPSTYFRFKPDYLDGWIELYHKSRKKDLSSKAQRELNKILRYPHDAIKSFEVDMHNFKTDRNAGIHRIYDLMRKEGHRTPKEFVEFLSVKWEAIHQKEEEEWRNSR